jgi:hypothetical protein
MNPQSNTLVKITKGLIVVSICLASLLLIRGRPVSGNAQSSAEQPPKERILENTIPNHVPIKVKIKKEKEQAFKDLNNKRWARDFELEVTNTGDKPIYSLSLMLITDVKAAAGFRIVAPLHYGKLGKVTDLAKPGDVSIKPTETYVFKIHPGQLAAWDTIGPKENRPYPTRIKVKLEGMSFGDGTGLVGNDGEAIPHAPYKKVGPTRCLDKPNWPDPVALAWDKQPINIMVASVLPADFLPVNLLLPNTKLKESISLQPIAAPEDCCSALIVPPSFLVRIMSA